jgi:hypothetical protein
MTFKQDEDETPVLFRVHKLASYGRGEVTAVFPCEPGTYSGRYMSCYAHVGQHGQCGLGWYQRTRAATPEEYACLKRELEGAPYGYRLKVYRRMSRQLRDRFWAEQRRINALRP